MTELSLDRINQKAIYRVIEGETDSNTFFFTTITGTDYAISFTEDMEIANCLSYQFIIRRLNNQQGGRDSNIQKTIMAIIEEFFHQNKDILLYTCDASDSKEGARNRLFIRWFEEAEFSTEFILKTANTIIEMQGFYFAIIIPKCHPKVNEICTEFDSVAEKLSQKPM